MINEQIENLKKIFLNTQGYPASAKIKRKIKALEEEKSAMPKG